MREMKLITVTVVVMTHSFCGPSVLPSHVAKCPVNVYITSFWYLQSARLEFACINTQELYIFSFSSQCNQYLASLPNYFWLLQTGLWLDSYNMPIQPHAQSIQKHRRAYRFQSTSSLCQYISSTDSYWKRRSGWSSISNIHCIVMGQAMTALLYREHKQHSPAGQFSKTWPAMSVAESLGEKVKSCVFPLTSMSRRFTCRHQSKFIRRNSIHEKVPTKNPPKKSLRPP